MCDDTKQEKVTNNYPFQLWLYFCLDAADNGKMSKNNYVQQNKNKFVCVVILQQILSIRPRNLFIFVMF